MRVVFFSLLVINLLIFLWGREQLGEQRVGREPARLAQQIAPDKLRIVSDDKLVTQPPAPAQ